MNTWKSVDSFGRILAGPAWLKKQVSDELIQKWAHSEDRWWRRAALVSTVALNMRFYGGCGDDPSASLPVTLVEPDMRFAHIRRSDQASMLHPRKVASRFRQPGKTQLTLLVTGPPGPASSEYVPEDLPKRRTRLLNKADGKNRESENPEEISLLSGRNLTVVLEHRGKRFETENRQKGKEVTQVFVNTAETTRPRRGCPTGSGVNGRPPKLADGNMAPHMILSFGTILCSSDVTCRIKRIYRNLLAPQTRSAVKKISALQVKTAASQTWGPGYPGRRYPRCLPSC